MPGICTRRSRLQYGHLVRFQHRCSFHFPSHVRGVDVHLHVQQNPYGVGVVSHGSNVEGREPRPLSQQPDTAK